MISGVTLESLIFCWEKETSTEPDFDIGNFSMLGFGFVIVPRSILSCISKVFKHSLSDKNG
jgi:hypothetical protein